MSKKWLSIMLIVMMLVSACGFSMADGVTGETEEVVINGITYHRATDLTTEPITLTYFHFDQDETVQYLANRFMELYPNITVKVQYENVSTYDDTLLTLVSNKNTPDIIMYSDCDFALSNMLLSDISAYWNSDPETAKIASTINSAGVGTFMTKARYAVPVKFFPTGMYVDLNVIENLNLDAPERDWTWEDMITLIKDATEPNSPDGMAYYGCGYYNRLDSYYGIAASQDIIGEFGFNGKTFNLGVWAVGEQEFADLKQGGYIAPSTETQEMEDWTDDWEAWAGATGHVALFTEAFWTYMGTWATEAYQKYNLDIVPYVVPAVSEEDASKDHHTIATIDFGGITPSCQHPREAYELLKFMSYGIDGWKTRIEVYNNESITKPSGLPLKYDVMPCPITTDEEVWAGYTDMYCKGMDDEHRECWEEYFSSCMQPIPYGWTSIAGYWNYCDEYFNSIGIHDLVDSGKAKAADYADEATRMANLYHANAMLRYFGPDGYNVLSEDEIAEYTQMVADNT